MGKRGTDWLMEFLSSEALQEGWDCFGSGRSILEALRFGGRRALWRFWWKSAGKVSTSKASVPLSSWTIRRLHTGSQMDWFWSSQQKSIPLSGPTIKKKREPRKPGGMCEREILQDGNKALLAWYHVHYYLPKGPRGLMDGALTYPEVSLCWTNGTSSPRASTFSWHMDLL